MGAEMPLQHLVKTMVRQMVPLQSLEDPTAEQFEVFLLRTTLIFLELTILRLLLRDPMCFMQSATSTLAASVGSALPKSLFTKPSHDDDDDDEDDDIFQQDLPLYNAVFLTLSDREDSMQVGSE
ncbi:hypothetical protein WISP_109177 [Willisornis vidua]|uniref:Uncharacterized protein n=1 Tax=Willisornis vidua TaxID=1566151 RepID=A0ABQ9CW11_9PASS|nr:hypothetical protein WISP_109177 [Willisornis vidua]